MPDAALRLVSSPHASCGPVPPTSVQFTGGLLKARWDTNAGVALLSQALCLAEYGNLDNFRRLHDASLGPFRGKVFNDSDVYKWIEAASWVVAQRPSAELQSRLDGFIGLIEAAQGEDGYLNTYYALERAGERWTNLRDNHELYCAGHLFQAAVAHHRGTGSGRLLRVAERFADLLCEVFGPASEGKNPGIDGHELIELALVELYRETGHKRYLNLAGHFIRSRGQRTLQGGWFGIEYFQDHQPFLEQQKMVGHAVRALYFNAGVADFYLEDGEPRLLVALQQMWDHMAAHQLYVSGGLGSRHHGEALGADYELPNEQAYTETCAAIGSMMWCQRMMAATADAKFADLYEHTLYNAMLPGWSADGLGYFYVNPLANDGQHVRQRWYECACCPPNVARTVAALPGSVYFTGGRRVHVMLYAESEAMLDLDGLRVGLKQQTRYPWDGDVAITVEADGRFELMLRIPQWCRSGAQLSVNGEPWPGELVPGTFVEVSRHWQPGDTLRLQLPMLPRLLASHPRVLENTGRVALTRGPLLYCIEAHDHPGVALADMVLGQPGEVQPQWQPELLGGLVVLHSAGQVQAASARWQDRLYLEPAEDEMAQTTAAALTAIPYFAWNNRRAGAMQVWLKHGAKEQAHGQP